MSLYSSLNLLKRLNFIIKNSGNSNLRYIIFILIVKAFLETAGIGLIYPFIDLVINKDFIYENILFNYLLKNNFISHKNQFLMLMGFCLIIFYISSAFFSIYSKIKSDDFIWKTNTDIVKLSYKKHIYSDLNVYKKSNTNKNTHDIINEVHLFINGFLLNFLDIIPRVFLLLFFTCYLILINPIITIVAFLFIVVFYSLFLSLLTKKIDKMSEKRYKFQTRLFDYVNSSIRAIKDIKVNAFEEYFIEKVKKPAYDYSLLNRDISIYTSFPKYIIELIVLISIVFFTLHNLNKANLLEYIPVLTIFSLSFVKLFPITQGMFTNITRIRFNYNSLAVVENSIHEIKNIGSTRAPKNFDVFESLELKNISFSYDDKSILKNQTLKINKGDLCLLFGESGSGKTTLIEILLGFFPPNKGEIILNGKLYKRNLLLSSKLNIGYVSQDLILFEGGLIENITLKKEDQRNHKNKDIKELLSFCYLDDVVKSLGGIDGFISEGGKNLSEGQKQRIILARALYKQPDLLVLDEATSALNKNLEKKIIETLIEKKITIVLITHNESLKKYSKNIFTLK
jgi:ABC-type multidrug transport system fused ATPase/permease subunit